MGPRTRDATGLPPDTGSSGSSSSLPAIGDADLTDDEVLDKTLARLSAAGVGPVASATLMEIAALGVDPRLSSVAASALELARQMDSRNSATAKSMCAGRLQEAMDRLLELNPPTSEATPLDQLKERRTARIAAASG